MALPVHFQSGVSTVAETNPLYEFGMPDPTKWHGYFNDFDTYVAADWTVTEIGAGGTEALTDGNGGLLLLTTDTLDNDSVDLQKVGESFLLTAGKKTFFKARFKVSDATQSDFLIGLAVTDSVLLSATNGDGVTDGVFFAKEDGDASLDVYCQKNTTTGQTSAAAIHTMVDDTFLTVAWFYDGDNELKYYVNDVQKGTLDASSTYLPDTELTISVAWMNGSGGAKTMNIDYIGAWQER